MGTRIVHTADWHLGARLIEMDRHEEHVMFLDWLLLQLRELKPDLLIVAGDIFDAANPPQEALKLYYGFLSRLTEFGRTQVLILGGNHDSPALLHAPRDVLRALNVRVIAAPPPDPNDALLEFDHSLVCAVPYLRERDLRTATAGESSDEIAAAIRDGLAHHYRAILAVALQKAAGRAIVATGHLTALGSEASPSERIIHIGNLGSVPAGCFDGFAYTALGHIHRPQRVGSDDTVRYAGSPLALSFAEVDLGKEIRVIEVDASQVVQRAIAVPIFRPLLRVTANAAQLAAALAQHQAFEEGTLEPWIELTVPDGREHPDLDQQVRTIASHLRLRVLKVQIPSPTGEAGIAGGAEHTLDDLQPAEVFAERLRRECIDPAAPEGQTLVALFAELLSGLHDEGAKKSETAT